MATLLEHLTGYPHLGLDSALFIYHFEAHPTYSPLTKVVFQGLEAGTWAGITSTITLMELTVRPWQLERGDIAREYEALLVNFPNLTIADIDREVARQAAQLRSTYQLRPADALQLATCLVHHGDAFLTNDKRLAKVEPVLKLLILDDYISRT
jgi:predicted nucleic acid-binding protein